MNKYRDKSDFEINKAVAVSLGYTAEYENESVTVFRNNNGGMPLVVSSTADSSDNFDPCNKPVNAMPIINEYGISLMYQDREFQVATNDGNYYCCMSNPLKAAMVIFLMMKEAENE
ncbi:phage protein NinX family protein [Morganella morganii]|uniref:phage protein NinX family protein n=1 Tax=Morganella morganii TaxID=582 RepID=UPI0030BC15B1